MGEILINKPVDDHFMKKASNRIRSFHLRYLELCRSKNYQPIPEVRAKSNVTSVLEFFGDKIRLDDWLIINESLYKDQTLKNVSIRLRKNYDHVLENLDTEKKARMLKKQPMIVSKFVFSHLIDAMSNCVKCNRNLNTLILEGLPLHSMYVISIAKALSINENLQTLSFNRSSIGDEGCEVICSTVKRLLHIESISMAQCQLTVRGADHIADMIKFQKIYRYSEGWKKSLRYRDVDPDTLPGLRSINIAQNNIGDKGTEVITEILKEDVWIREIDLSDCGLTDDGAKFVLDCLQMNKCIIEFHIKKNSHISPNFVRTINEQLGREDEEKKKNKFNAQKIRERVQMLEDQIVLEKNLRKQVENLNEQLHAQIMCYERQLNEEPEVPEGYSLIMDEDLESLMKERDEYKASLEAIKMHAKSRNSRKMSKIRKARSETMHMDGVNGKTANHISNSEHGFNYHTNVKPPPVCYNEGVKSVYVEKNIGDTCATIQPEPIQVGSNLKTDEKQDIYSAEESIGNNGKKCGNNAIYFRGIEEAMKLFAQKRQNIVCEDAILSNQLSNARNLFMGNE